MDAHERQLRTLGRTIAQLRTAEGITQRRLSLMIGYTDHAFIARVESGAASPSIEALFTLADALEVEVKHFFISL